MKKILLALCLVVLPFVAQAQEALDTGPNIPPYQNFAILKDTRWMPTINLASINTSNSQRVAAPMGGTLIEGWLTLDPLFPANASSFNVYVSISHRGGTVFPAGFFTINTNAQRGGDPVPAQFSPGAVMNEGDAIVVFIPSITGGAAVVGRIDLRIAN